MKSGRVAWQGKGGRLPHVRPLGELLADLPAISTVTPRVCRALAGTWLGTSSPCSGTVVTLL